MTGYNEIERKFLVISNEYQKMAISSTHIVQGFLNKDPERTVRIRIRADKAYLTVKGKSNVSGTTRFEWEVEVAVEEAQQLLLLCEPSVIEKTRYVVPMGQHFFEVDEFGADNEGLVVAEIELNSEHETFERPSWLGAEVTGQIKYYNSQLSNKPFKQWTSETN